MKKSPKLLLLLAIAIVAPRLCWADVMFILGNNPQPGEENVLLNKGETGSTVTGSTNQSHIGVNFISTAQTLTVPAKGQPRIEGTNDGSHVALTDIAFTLGSGILGTFTDAIFNMHIGGTGGASGGTVGITAITNGGAGFVSPVLLGNGDNFVTVVATRGSRLGGIEILSAIGGGFTDLRQVRISGAVGPSVPDSGMTLTLLGTSLLAVALLRRTLVV